MSQNGSTSVHFCACGCNEPVKPGQRWYEPACKARAYRAQQRGAQADAEQELLDANDRLIDDFVELRDLRRQLADLEEVYTRLLEEHQSCQRSTRHEEPPRWWGGDAYEVLGVRPDAEIEAIEGAYKALVRKYHPDRHPGNPTVDVRMKAITAAYDEVRRRRGHR